MIRVGVDVGGTHTDLVLVDDRTGAVAVHKAPTSAHDPSVGAIAALQELCARAGHGLEQIGYFIHGTTIATNIILEHNGARTATSSTLRVTSGRTISACSSTCPGRSIRWCAAAIA
jgi:N-methylhydantoinase A